MPIVPVAEVHAPYTTPTNATSAPIDTTGANLLVVCLGCDYGSVTTTVTDSKGNTWVQLEGQNNQVLVEFWYCLNPVSVGAGHTFTATTSTAAYPGIHVYTFSGAEQLQFIKNTGSNIGSTKTLNFGDMAPAFDGSLILTLIGSDTSGALTVTPAGFQPVSQIPWASGTTNSIAATYQIQPTAATIAPIWTISSGASVINVMATLAVFLPIQAVVAPSAGQIVFHGAAFANVQAHPYIGGAGDECRSHPINTTGANLLVAWTTASNSIPVVFDSKGNTWVKLTNRNSSSAYGVYYYSTAPVVGPNHTFTFLDLSSGAATVFAFSGVNLLQVEVGATAAALPLASGSVTPVSNGALVLAGLASRGPAASSHVAVAPAGFRMFQNITGTWEPNKNSFGYFIQPTAGAINPTWSAVSGTPDNCVATTVVFTQGAPTGSGRVSQLPLEVLISPTTPVVASLSQLPLEVLLGPLPAPVRVSQIAVEVVIGPPPPAVRVTQVAVEVIYLPGVGAGGDDGGPFMGAISGYIWVD